MFDSEILTWCFESKPSAQFLISLFEIREIFEPSAAALAAKRGTDDQIKAIETAYSAMASATLGSDEVISADIDFHMSILDATNNEFMISLGVSITAALTGSFRLSSSKHSEYVDSLPGHKAVFLGIQARDPDRARFEMESLLSKSIDWALEGLEGADWEKEAVAI